MTDAAAPGAPTVLAAAEIAALVEAARASPRLRAHRNLHAALDEPVNRLAIAMQPGSYVRPHRHPDRFELLIALRGAFDLVLFDDSGAVTRRQRLSAPVGGDGSALVELAPGTWHSLVALEDGSVFFEVKQGPYRPASAQDTMPWAAAEGSERAARCMEFIREARIGERFADRS